MSKSSFLLQFNSIYGNIGIYSAGGDALLKALRKGLKIILAGIAAIAILCGLFSVYFLSPIHVANPKGNTDYVWPANARWIQMKEGISWGKYDANGYNNLQVIDNPDILVLGSSHMEATNVMQHETTAAVLNDLLGGRYGVYNLGISGHHFTKVCKYLPVTMELYEQAPDVIIIETDSVSFTRKEVDELLSGEVDVTPSHDSGLMVFLQKLPFFRLGYHQLNGGLLDLLLPEKESETKNASGPQDKNPDETVYQDLFAYIHDVMEDYDTQVIIFYHPTESIRDDGTLTFSHPAETVLFEACCQENGILFLNMETAFLEMYEQEQKLPHGFTNGEAGVGHLNAAGHACIAQELAKAIAQLEKAGALCK